MEHVQTGFPISPLPCFFCLSTLHRSNDNPILPVPETKNFGIITLYPCYLKNLLTSTSEYIHNLTISQCPCYYCPYLCLFSLITVTISWLVWLVTPLLPFSLFSVQKVKWFYVRLFLCSKPIKVNHFIQNKKSPWNSIKGPGTSDSLLSLSSYPLPGFFLAHFVLATPPVCDFSNSSQAF